MAGSKLVGTSPTKKQVIQTLYNRTKGHMHTDCRCKIHLHLFKAS